MMLVLSQKTSNTPHADQFMQVLGSAHCVRLCQMV
jgi:hypothetical protein